MYSFSSLIRETSAGPGDSSRTDMQTRDGQMKDENTNFSTLIQQWIKCILNTVNAWRINLSSM